MIFSKVNQLNEYSNNKGIDTECLENKRIESTGLYMNKKNQFNKMKQLFSF
jgi:hypothetical protein